MEKFAKVFLSRFRQSVRKKFPPKDGSMVTQNRVHVITDEGSSIKKKVKICATFTCAAAT